MIDLWRRVRAAARLGTGGAAAVEFAFVAPVLLLIMVGIAQFGIALNQYVMLWNGVGVAAMQFAISGGGASSTPASQYAWTPLTQNAPTLTTGGTCGATPTSLCMTLTVNGTSCTSASGVSSLSAAQSDDSACNTALTSPSNIGTPAVVTAKYPCNLNVGFYNFWPSCVLTAQIAEPVQ